MLVLGSKALNSFECQKRLGTQLSTVPKFEPAIEG